MYSILEWYKEIEDINTLNKIYSLVFYHLLEIQKVIFNTFKMSDNIPFEKINVLDLSHLYMNLVNKFCLLDQKQIIEILTRFKNMKI